MRRKLGLPSAEPGDEELIADWLRYLDKNELDYTLGFRELATRAGAADEPRFGDFETRWRQRVTAGGRAPAEIAAAMNAVNPLYIPRNHRIEQAIRSAVDGDTAMFAELATVLARPFDEQPEYARYAEAPEPEERVAQTFCGT